MKNLLKLLAKKVWKGCAEHITSQSLYLGAILAVGIFSKYIFGPDNFAEEVAEFFYQLATGVQLDFSIKKQ